MQDRFTVFGSNLDLQNLDELCKVNLLFLYGSQEPLRGSSDRSVTSGVRNGSNRYGLSPVQLLLVGHKGKVW